MAAKRIYQIAKEFAREDKEIIDFLTNQGIKVGNRLSAVSEEAYNLLKAKFTEQPKVEEPEPPKVEPAAKPAPVDEKPADDTSKKKKKNKNPQQQQNPPQGQQQQGQAQLQQTTMLLNKATQDVYNEAIQAGNAFIGHYVPFKKRKHKNKIPGTGMDPNMDSWAILQRNRFEHIDSSPCRYWQAVNKLTTSAFAKIQDFGLKNRELMGEMREALKPVGADYQPREIFTAEENELFAKHQLFLFETFGHGQGKVNDHLLELKIHCERMTRKFARMDFVDYLTNPDTEFNVKPPVPFDQMADVIAHSMRGITERVIFFRRNKEVIAKVIEIFFDWVDGYQKLKEAGADDAKLQTYLKLEGKFIQLTEFMAMDNLLYVRRKEVVPYLQEVELLRVYRDDLDNPEAEEQFKYHTRGLMNILFKPKEYVFMWHLAELT